MNKIALFNTFPISKKDQEIAARSIVSQCLEGDVDPLRVKVQLSALEGLIKKIKENTELNVLILKKAEERNARSFDEYGGMFQIKETGAKFDFSVCQDLVWTELYKESESIKELMKEREAFLKNIPVRGQNVVDDETGEVYMIYPPSKRSTTSVTVTIK